MFQYLTYYQPPRNQFPQTIDQLLSDLWEGKTSAPPKKYRETITVIPKSGPRAHILKYFSPENITTIRDILVQLTPNDLTYHKFLIPKHNGGVRELNAPNEELKEYQRGLTSYLKNMCQLLPHNAAFAYVENRSTQDALIKHQENHSHYFLKIDLRHFFPSCSFDFVREQLLKNYTYQAILQHVFRVEPDADPFINTVLPYAFLDNALPQGSPASPYLSNLAMIPIDYHISKHLEPNGYIYTRYADDILISHKEHFNIKYILNLFENDILKDTPLSINKEKIRFGTNAGRNWNLGLMLNKDDKITIGHQRHRELKSLLNNFFAAHIPGSPKPPWTREEIQIFDGQLAYFISIEPDYAQFLIKKYEKLYNQNYRILVKRLLNK